MAITEEEKSGEFLFPRNLTEMEVSLVERECESLELGCREDVVQLQRVDREEEEEDAIDSAR